MAVTSGPELERALTPIVTPIGEMVAAATKTHLVLFEFSHRHMFVTADLKPGKYVLLCFIPDARDGRPHSAHGMAKEITVEP